MEVKEYPTRSKSGVRKIRKPWDNSASVMFDELVAQKKSPKPSPARKDGEGVGESPKTTKKKANSKSPSVTPTHGTLQHKQGRGSEGKAKGGKSSSTKSKPSESVKKSSKASPVVSSRPPKTSPLTKILYDYSHSPTAQIAAVTITPSKGIPGSLSREGAGSGGKKVGGLYKAQRTGKVSKSAQQKLQESLKIFDFSSDSGSEEEEVVPVKKPAKRKTTPPAAPSVSERISTEKASPKKKTDSNYRYTVM